jgi:Cu(I)/Ag(I) efflux system membrane fusion protein
VKLGSSSTGRTPEGEAEGEAATRRQMQAGLKAGDVDPVTGRRILYWHDPMVPGSHFEAPGRSPFMDMMMSPVYEGAPASGPGVSIDPRMRQNLGIRTAPATMTALSTDLSAVGAIAFDERDQVVLQARAAGFVERVHVRAVLDTVPAGAPVVDLQVPDWIAAQEEYLAVRRMQGADLGAVVAASRERLRQLGMPEALVATVEREGRPQARLVVTAPIGGVATELDVRDGMTVSPGMTLVKLNGLSTVWAEAQVPQSRIDGIHAGDPVTVGTPGGGAVVAGRVQALVPGVDPATRTLKVRVSLPNPGRRLLPGMTVDVRFGGAPGQPVLTVPSEAVIRTGRRSMVMVAAEGGRFRPVTIETGREAGDRIEVTRGLQRGEQVVTSGQFLIDSEANLRGVEARDATEPAVGTPPHLQGEGSR